MLDILLFVIIILLGLIFTAICFMVRILKEQKILVEDINDGITNFIAEKKKKEAELEMAKTNKKGVSKWLSKM